MHVYVGVVTCSFVCHMLMSVQLCFFFLHAPVCLRVKWPCFLKKGWSWEGACFCVFPSTYLLSLVIHGMRQRNELAGLGCGEGLRQNQRSDIE